MWPQHLIILERVAKTKYAATQNQETFEKWVSNGPFCEFSLRVSRDLNQSLQKVFQFPRWNLWMVLKFSFYWKMSKSFVIPHNFLGLRLPKVPEIWIVCAVRIPPFSCRITWELAPTSVWHNKWCSSLHLTMTLNAYVAH